jgi:predicted TIM-barrel fold metal-dependent hydrolase
LSALVKVTDPSHILFGSDFPFAPASAIRHFGEVLEHTALPFERAEVYRGNAAKLLEKGA